MDATSQSVVLSPERSTSQGSKDPFLLPHQTMSQLSGAQQQQPQQQQLRLRESFEERPTERCSTSTESYEDEKEEEYQETEAKGERRTLKIAYGESMKKPRRVLSLKTIAKSAATAVRHGAMVRKGRKASPKAGAAIEDGAKVDGLADGDEHVDNIREKMIKDMQEEIRLEQYNQAQMVRLEAEQLEKYEAQLTKTRAALDRHWSAYAENLLLLQLQENWDRYMACDGLPDPGLLPDLNTFLFVWTMENENVNMVTVMGICDVITDLMAKLRRIVRFSDDRSREHGDEYESVSDTPHTGFIVQFQRIRKGSRWYGAVDREGASREAPVVDRSRVLPIAAQHRGEHDEGGHEDEQIRARVEPDGVLRVGADRVTRRRETLHGQGKKADRSGIQRDQADDQIAGGRGLPPHGDPGTLAGLRSLFRRDRFPSHAGSARGDERPLVQTPRYVVRVRIDARNSRRGTQRNDSLDERVGVVRALDLLEFARREYREKLRIWEEQAEERQLRLEEKKTILQKMENPPALPSVRRRGKRGKKQNRPKSAKNNASEFEQTLETFLPSDGEMLPYLPTPNEIVRQREEESKKEVRKILFRRCGKTEVNLRKYAVLGGVFRVDLIHQPPQPKDLGKDTSLTTLELPKEPRFAKFSRRYEPPQPAPDSERTPEVIEAEMKALETAMESLLLITVHLPDTVFWFEPPLVAHWIPEKKIWSTRDVHDIKYNEEKQTIAFRSGKLGVHGLAAYKFANLPFQSWELKPEMRKNGRDYGGVVLNVTAATVQAEFVVREDRVCLNSLAGGSSTPVKQILGEFVELETLIERMQRIGCDLFPERDAFSYLKGLPMKHPVAKKHLRDCMALLSTSYVFAWSRWNASRTFWEIVVQFKEVHGCVAKERTNLTLLVTPWRTMRVRCTEVSPEFSDLPLDDEDSKFYADLYQLATNTAGIKTRLLIQRVSFKLVTTVARLLERTNVIGMSS